MSQDDDAGETATAPSNNPTSNDETATNVTEGQEVGVTAVVGSTADAAMLPEAPPVPSSFAAVLERPATKVRPEDSRKTLLSLAKRIAACEKFIGDVKLVHESFKNEQSKSQAIDSLDTRQKEWIRNVENVIADKTPLANQIERVKRLTDQVFSGRPSELDKKLINLKDWMEAENANVSQLLLSQQAKETVILQNEGRLRETAMLLKQVEELKEYVNHPAVTNLSTYRNKINALEVQGNVIAEQAKRLYLDMEELSLAYCNAMTVLSSALANTAKKVVPPMKETAALRATSSRNVGFR